MSPQSLKRMPWWSVRLLPGIAQSRYALNRSYLMSLRSESLLQSFRMEAGLWQPARKPAECHWGWESPTCQVRGHFLGHWLSAAARSWAGNADAELKAKADAIVSELALCQRENGGEWAGSIPAKYLDWVARKKQVWAPHYTLHKTLMGLLEMHTLAGSAEALDVLAAWARWFHRWTGRFARAEMDDILDVETGGMLEVWADLFAVTGVPEHRELMERYDRPRLFDKLRAGEDVLTNRHANTTVPEVHGAARAWEVTGESRWREIVEAYWRAAVTDRGAFCTGGQTSGEFWTPKGKLAARLSATNQEHCVVYNMMRLAEYLLRWTGEAAYADYWERNLYNGIFAQQHPQTGQVAYFLPLQAGARKVWGHPTEDFWCCHGTLVQAHPTHASAVFYESSEGLAVCQYLSSSLTWSWEGTPVRVSLRVDPQTQAETRPAAEVVEIELETEAPADFLVALRIPWWVRAQPSLSVDGVVAPETPAGDGFLRVRRRWSRSTLRLHLPRGLAASPLHDAPETVAFLDGPQVLAGLCDDELSLRGDRSRPETMLVPDNEREFDTWHASYRTAGQAAGFRLVPLHEITDERYTVYFPVSSGEGR